MGKLGRNIEKAGKAGLAAVLAVTLSVPAVGLTALADGAYADDGTGDPAVVSEQPASPTDEQAATPSPENGSNAPAPSENESSESTPAEDNAGDNEAPAPPSVLDNSIEKAKIIVQLAHENIKGADAIKNYLFGNGFTVEDILAIDTAAVRQYSPELADEIEMLQRLLKGEAPDDSDNNGSSEPQEPEQPAPAPDTPSDNPGNGNGNGAGNSNSTPIKVIPSLSSSNAATAQDGEDTVEEKTEELVVPHPVLDGIAENSDGSAYPQWSYNGDSTYVPHNVGVNLTTEKFVAIIGEQAREIASENGLYASVMIAQAILESASGNSGLASTPNNNLFGIKGSYEGRSVEMRTIEYDDNATMYMTSASFRKYPSVRESLSDYAYLLTNSMGNFYSGVWRENTESYVDACDFLQGRYATDIQYSGKLQDLILTYDLTRYDNPLDYELLSTYEMPTTVHNQYSSSADLATGQLETEQRDLVDLIVEVTSHLGDDYVWGGTVPGAFDCSGLVQYSYKQALGLSIPRTSYYQCMIGDDVDFSDLHMGDLLFFADSEGEVGHVAMYLAEGCFIEAPQTGDVVKVTSFTEKMPTFAKRVVPTKHVDVEEAAMSSNEKFQKAVAIIQTRKACEAADALPISVGSKRL